MIWTFTLIASISWINVANFHINRKNCDIVMILTKIFIKIAKFEPKSSRNSISASSEKIFSKNIESHDIITLQFHYNLDQNLHKNGESQFSITWTRILTKTSKTKNQQHPARNKTKTYKHHYKHQNFHRFQVEIKNIVKFKKKNSKLKKIQKC